MLRFKHAHLRALRYLIAVAAGFVSLWLTLGTSAEAVRLPASASTFASPVYLPIVMAPLPVLPSQECPAWVHDRHTTIGPDGKVYPTWHPQIDPTYGCFFNHEHGDDPRTSLANSSMPPFGYVGSAASLVEPHTGFKVFVANAGSVNDEGRRALYSSRIVFHMGTGGPKRFTTQFHSLMFDLIGNGREMHIQGMADTGGVNSICEPRLGRTVVALGCSIQSLYEIWEIKLRLGSRATAIVSTAVFDPITMYDPQDPARYLLTYDVYRQFGTNNGCDREAYHGPISIYNGSGSGVFTTDAYGNPGSALRQVVRGPSGVGWPMSHDGQSQFKYRRDHCRNGLGLEN